MKQITETEYNTRFPNRNSEYFQKLSSSEKAVYINCLNYYYNYFIIYLIEKLDLLKHDQNLAKSNNKFLQVSEENMDIYQYLSSSFLKYLYIRNNLYLDRLSDEEITKLVNFQQNNTTLENSELLQFIESTYPRLIDEAPEKQTRVNYGPENAQFMADSKSIIIGVRTDEFYNANSTPNWSELHDNREIELDFFITYLRNELDKKLSIPIEVIRYNDFSVKKKTELGINDPIPKI